IAKGHLARGVEGLSGERLLRPRRKYLFFPIMDDFLRHPELCVYVRDDFCAGLGHSVVRSGGLEVPVRVDNGLHSAAHFEDVLRACADATIHEETSAFAGEGDDVVAGARDERKLLGELSCEGTRLSECGAGQTQGGGATSEGMQEITASRVVHG